MNGSTLAVMPTKRTTKPPASEERPKERLSKSQNEQVRRVANRVLNEVFGGFGVRMADAIGMKQSNLSRFLSGLQGTSAEAAAKILALGDVEPASVGLVPPPSDVFPSKPVVVHLRNWAQAETEARAAYKKVDEQDWLDARKFATGLSPAYATRDFVLHLALAAAEAREVNEAERQAMAEAKAQAEREDAERKSRR